MKFEEIKVNEIYEVWDVEHQVVYKHEESKSVFTLEVGSDTPYSFAERHLSLFKPIKNKKQNELDSTIEKLFKLTEELGIEVLLTLDNKEK